MLLIILYLIYFGLGLPESLLGSAWPTMQQTLNVPSSYAGYISMTISLMIVFAGLASPRIINFFHTKWIAASSISLIALYLFGFSFSDNYWLLFLFAIPYGLGAGALDVSINNYIANHYPSSIMNFLHFFFGLGAAVSPYIMALSLKKTTWNDGYMWTGVILLVILLMCLLSFPLWDKNKESVKENTHQGAGLKETIKVPGVLFTLIAFFSCCSCEATCFLWTPSYFAGTKAGLSQDKIASLGSLVFIGLMLGSLMAVFISNKMGDRLLIRIGVALELIGITLVSLSSSNYLIATAGFLIIGFGMGPIYPSIMHMAPTDFGKRYSATVIGLQMSFGYIGSTIMPMIFGHIQQRFGIDTMPIFLTFFVVLSITLLELSYRLIRRQKMRLVIPK